MPKDTATSSCLKTAVRDLKRRVRSGKEAALVWSDTACRPSGQILGSTIEIARASTPIGQYVVTRHSAPTQPDGTQLPFSGHWVATSPANGTLGSFVDEKSARKACETDFVSALIAGLETIAKIEISKK